MSYKYRFNKIFLCCLAVIVVSVWCMAVAQALTWEHNTERTDGAKMSISEVGGSRIYCGGSSGNYPDSWDIKGADNTAFNLSFTTAGRRYCVVTTYDTDGRESKYSKEISKDYIATIPDSIQAKPATDFVVTKIGDLRYRVSYTLPTEFTDGKPIHSMTKLYPFEHKDTDTDWRGTWLFDVNPVTNSFEVTVTERKTHFYTLEVETKVNEALEVSERGEIFVIDATIQVPLTPPKPPFEVSFESTDILKP